MNDKTNTTVLSQDILDYDSQIQNCDFWIKRYNTYSDISIDDRSNPQGHRINEDILKKESFLKILENRIETSNPQDKDRLLLIKDVETKIFNDSKFELREAMGALVEYDRNHGHPITDLTRDLNKEPYTMAEKHQWLNRDGRKMTDLEQKHFTQQGWDSDQHNKRERTASLNSDDNLWFVQEKFKGQAKENLEKKLEQGKDLTERNSFNPYPDLTLTNMGNRLEKFRQQKNEVSR